MQVLQTHYEDVTPKPDEKQRATINTGRSQRTGLAACSAMGSGLRMHIHLSGLLIAGMVGVMFLFFWVLR